MTTANGPLQPVVGCYRNSYVSHSGCDNVGILYFSLAIGQTRPAGKTSQQEIDKLIKESKKRVETGGDFTEEELNAALKKIIRAASNKNLKELDAE